jgi:transposase
MIPAGVQIFVALEPVDMRMGFERLAGIVRERMGLEPLGGALFVFLGRRRQCLKIVFSDGTGLCLFHKRLDKGRFPAPELVAGHSHAELDHVQLEALLDGLCLGDEERAPAKRSPRESVEVH